MTGEASNVSRVPLAPEVGYRLAGFVDGEACFSIGRHVKKATGTVLYMPAFTLNLRDDDAEVLRRYHRETGLGRVYQGGYRERPGYRNSKPLFMWQINTKAECLALVEILERFELWSKKRRDFEVWAKAVRYWNGPKPEGNAPLERWFHEIREVRKYDSPADLRPTELVAVPLFEDGQ